MRRLLASGTLVGTLVLALASCAHDAPPPATATATATAVQTVELVPTPPHEAGGPEVRAVLAGPPRLLYEPAAMRAPRPAVRITVRNTTGQPLDTRDLRARVVLARDGSPVPCGPAVDPPRDTVERASLAPGEAATYVRTLDCALRLTGAYAAQVVVSFGDVPPWNEGRSVGILELAVHAPPDAGPRPLGVVPGVFAGIGASPAQSAAGGAGHIVVALVNGSRSRVALPPLRIAFKVRRHGETIACVDEPIVLATPEVLDPGASHSAPVAVSCLGLGVPGKYDVEAFILADDGGRRTEQPIGALKVEISGDPASNARVLR